MCIFLIFNSIEVSVIKVFIKNKSRYFFIMSYVVNNSIISAQQYGFMPGMSTELQIIEILCLITSAFDDHNVKCIDCIFLDASNAYDKIPFGLLFQNLYNVGFRSNSLTLI